MIAADRRPPPPPEQQHHNVVDRKVWQACAGASIEIPALDSRVLYFPQGHIEHASDSVDLDSFCPDLAFSVLCRVVGVRLLADENTDEVFALIRLDPRNLISWNSSPMREDEDDEKENEEEENGVVSFAKVLTQSDANNGGGFSVPKFCADSIFPPLDYAADPPVQNIRVRDVHGKTWEFRHIYRGVPRRHLLTTGWSKFVNSKKLIAGDSVVFMKNKGTGELVVGVRRTLKSSALGDFAARFAALGEGRMKVDEGVMRVGEKERVFSRSGKGKVAPEAVVEAANRAAKGLPFEVLYYPRVGSANFVVNADKVGKAMNSIRWHAGMRVKMAMETEDSSRMTGFQGAVSSLAIPDSGLWRGSPWRMLKVTWDEPEVLHNMEKVSPWEVEYVTPTPSLADIFPQPKKLKGSHGGEFSLPMIGFGNSFFGQFSSSQLNNYLTFPTGMQGARQDTKYVSSLSNIINNGASQLGAVDYSYQAMTSKNDDVSTELIIGTPLSQSPPDSASSVDTLDLQTRVSTQKTLQLFGQCILVDNPIATAQEGCPAKGDDIQVFKGVKFQKASAVKA